MGSRQGCEARSLVRLVRLVWGVKVAHVLNEFRVNGTTRCASACAASRTSEAIERSLLTSDT
jgi:hypothetical protein